MARAPNKGLTPELRRFADLLRAEGVQAQFSYAGRGGEPSSPRVKVRIDVDAGPPVVSRHVSLNVRRSPEQFVVVVDEYETDEDGLIVGPRELEKEPTRTVYEAEQIFAQLVAKYRGRKKGPVGERDERYRVPLPNPSVAPIRADNLHKFGLPETPGGRYLEMPSRTDLTGRVYAIGVIDVTGMRPRFETSDETATLPTGRGRTTAKVNLYRGGSRWKWIEGGVTTAVVENLPVIVSVERGGKHLYALRVDFETPVVLATYPKQKTEPRLRPTARVARVDLDEEIGRIRAAGREHPVYAAIRLR